MVVSQTKKSIIAIQCHNKDWFIQRLMNYLNVCQMPCQSSRHENILFDNALPFCCVFVLLLFTQRGLRLFRTVSKIKYTKSFFQISKTFQQPFSSKKKPCLVTTFKIVQIHCLLMRWKTHHGFQFVLLHQIKWVLVAGGKIVLHWRAHITSGHRAHGVDYICWRKSSTECFIKAQPTWCGGKWLEPFPVTNNAVKYSNMHHLAEWFSRRS